MTSQNPEPTGFRWRPLRLRRDTWPGEDAGPLAVLERNGGRRWIDFGWRRYVGAPDNPCAPDQSIAMPYPTAAPGSLTRRAWTAPWRTGACSFKRAVSMLADAASMLLWLAPAIAALGGGTPDAMFLAAGLAMSGLLLRHAAALGALDRDRTESTAVHGRLWDRLIALASEHYRRSPTRLAAEVEQAIKAALFLASLRRRAVAPAVALVAASALLAAISTTAAAVAAIGLAVFAAVICRLVSRQSRCARSAAIAAAAFNREAEFLARHLPRLRDLGVAHIRKRMLHDLAAAAGDAVDHAQRTEHAVQTAQHIGLAASAVAVTALLPWLVPGIAIRDVVSVLLLAPVAVFSTALLAGLHGQRSEQLQSIAAIDDLLQPDVDADGAAFEAIQTVSLRAVSYQHEAGPVVLEDIDLTIERGEVLALSGASGAGKSTLLRIVMGLVDPSTGEVVVNGRLLRAAHAAAFRAGIAAVLQNEDLGTTTVRNAVASGRAGMTVAEICDALADVGLLEDVLALPMGLQTLVIAGSFPQSFCHRLMIARSLAAATDFLVFDETLTDLDPTVAQGILDAARRRGAAVIFSTHKPVLLEFADRAIRLPPHPQAGAGGTAMSDTQ